MKSTRTPARACPTCGKKLDAASSLFGDHTPNGGDVTVCLYCAEVLIFRKNLTAFKPSYSTLMDIQRSTAWPMVERTRNAVLQLGTEYWKKNAGRTQ